MTAFRCTALVILLVLTAPGYANSTTAARSWDFSVLLDGSNIGYHRFELTQTEGQRWLRSEAKFDVRVLFFNAFRYRHTNTEVWSDGCLEKIKASTQANGKKLAVTGSRVDDRFVINDGDATSALQDCVMTFAYWNPEFLQQPRLLDPQSGEYLEVEVEPVGQQAIVVRGEEVAASVYRVKAKKMELTVWYSQDDE